LKNQSQQPTETDHSTTSHHQLSLHCSCRWLLPDLSLKATPGWLADWLAGWPALFPKNHRIVDLLESE